MSAAQVMGARHPGQQGAGGPGHGVREGEAAEAQHEASSEMCHSLMSTLDVMCQWDEQRSSFTSQHNPLDWQQTALCWLVTSARRRYVESAFSFLSLFGSLFN